MVGLRAVAKVRAIDVEIHSDSHLEVSPVKVDFEARDLRMINYSKLAHSL